MAQCGLYGYIYNYALLSNTREHESGFNRGHYKQYRRAMEDPEINPGTVAEAIVKGPATSDASFVALVNTELRVARDYVIGEFRYEDCNHDTTRDYSCTVLGVINEYPYTPCPDLTNSACRFTFGMFDQYMPVSRAACLTSTATGARLRYR